MISTTLMKQTIKANLPLWLILTLIQAVMVALVAGLGSSLQTTALAYYNMIPELLSAIYVILTANKLISAQVDRGTMAYILSTPVKRSKVAFTQAICFLGSLFIMFAISAVAHILSQMIATGSISAGEIKSIILLNLGLFVLNTALSGICFLASCSFNLSKYTTAVGGGIVGAFLLLSLMPMFGTSFKWMKDITIDSLYDINTIIANNTEYIWKFLVLLAIGLVTYVGGAVIFKKRDLPL